MFDVRSNSFENKLFFTAKGRVELDEIKMATSSIIKNAKALMPGFVTIMDIRELAPACEEGRLEIQQTMKSLKDMGLAAEFRIIADQNMVTANQFQRTSRSVGYTAVEVHSLIEAERMIDELQ